MNEAALLERTMPHNLEAERSVLGAILLHNDAYVQVAGWLQANEFYRDAHRRIFESMARLLEHPQGSVDLVTLREDLGRHGDMDNVGGPAYISKLVDGIPRSMNIRRYAGIVKEQALLRAMIHASNKLLTDAYSGEDPARELLMRADRTFLDLQQGHLGSNMLNLPTRVPALLDELEYRLAHRGQLRGVDTGFQSINDQTSGWMPGDVIVLAARPSMGKTALVLNSAVAAAQSKRRDETPRHVGLFSLEMAREQLELRMLSARSGVPLSSILDGYCTEEQYGRLTQAMGELAELNIHIDDTAGRTVEEIRAECRRLQVDHGLDLIIVDYVQLVAGSNPQQSKRAFNRNEEMTHISRAMKSIARHLRVPLLLLSQLNRASAARADKRPELSDLRESGALEQDADIVAFLHRKSHRQSGVTNFILEKQRNGPTGTVNLTFDRDIQLFTDGGEETEPAPVPPAGRAEQSEEEQQAEKVRKAIRSRSKRR